LHASGEQLVFARNGAAPFAYDLRGLIEVISRGFKSSEFGLMACEPNWVYPICNCIGASAVAVFDRIEPASRWQDLAALFRRGLEDAGITLDGRFVAARSTLTGFATPPIGGIVMQALPCLFLNAADPDLAWRHWMLVRRRLMTPGWRRRVWPIDTGNYNFSRASGYAAIAAAAVEMGDETVAARMLSALEEEFPATIDGDVAHRPGVSLWAHALEIMARSSRKGLLQSFASPGNSTTTVQPYVATARYPDVLFAKAVAAEGGLSLVIYPGSLDRRQPIGLAGLEPGRAYCVCGATGLDFSASDRGEAEIFVELDGRQGLTIQPNF
jgi:hypothetical protein